MGLDIRHCYQAMKARDPRFDGVFFVGVTTTGVYCRPVCTVRMPRLDRCRFFPSAASAEAAGFRPCLRCRPELAPGHAPVDAVRRAARSAARRLPLQGHDGECFESLARELDLSARQLYRAIEAEYGVSPLALVQTRRLLLAKQLLCDTRLRVIDVAFASGFSSVRQFNRAFARAYRMSPRALRSRRAPAHAHGIVLKLGLRPPLAWAALTQFLLARACGRSEGVDAQRYVRTVRIGEHAGWIAAAPTADSLLQVVVDPALLPVLPELQTRLRRLFDLDANPTVIDAQLGRDARLRQLVASAPGLRVPGALCGFELALRAVLGQQVSVRAATTLFERFVTTFGRRVTTPFEGIDHVGPSAADLTQASVSQIAALGLPHKRAQTISCLAHAVADGDLALDPSPRFDEIRRKLRAIAGIGPWTAEYIAMRALGDPDAFPHSDLGLMRALRAHSPGELLALSEDFRPFRAYAALHLWTKHARGG